MESSNVIVNDQGTIPIVLRSNESEIEGLLRASGDDVSVNDITPGNRSNPDTEDASPFAESSSQSEDPTTSTVGSNRESSKQVQEDHPTIDIIGDPKAGVQTRGKPKVNHREMMGYMCYNSSIEPKTSRKVWKMNTG